MEVSFGERSRRIKADRDITIKIRGVRLRPSRNGMQYWLADINELLGCYIDCDGTMVRPRIVVKIFCKVPQKLRDQHREWITLNRKRLGRPPRVLPPH